MTIADHIQTVTDQEIEAVARKMYAIKIGAIKDVDGLRAPDDLWRQYEPMARAALRVQKVTEQEVVAAGTAIAELEVDGCCCMRDFAHCRENPCGCRKYAIAALTAAARARRDARAALTAAAQVRPDEWKHGAECMREAILQQLPGGQSCDPQQVADMIRAIALPGAAK